MYNIEIDYNGKKYKSLKQLSRETGINYSTLKHRLFKQNLSVEEAIKNSDKRFTSIELNGKKYSSIKELSDQSGVSQDLINNRLQQGKTINEAISLPKKITKQGKPGIYNGIPYKSIAELSRKTGINESKLTREISKWNKDL